MMFFRVAMRAGLDASRARLHAFLQKIHARPAYRRALERGGKYDFYFSESGAGSNNSTRFPDGS
jgi:hypothetical protein